jgi:hypothetical protein
MIKNSLKHVVVTGLALVSLVAIVPFAGARSSPIIGGAPHSSGDTTCYSEANGGITNTCPRTVQWIVPLTADAGGSFNPTFVASSTSVQCGTLVATQTGTSSFSGWKPSPGAGVAFQSSAVTLAANGTMFATCQLPQNTGWQSVNW